MRSFGGNSWIVLIAATVLFAACGQAGADILFSTLDTGDSYSTEKPWSVGTNSHPSPWPGCLTQGDQFSFAGSQAYFLDSIELAAGLHEGENQLNVLLMTDAGDQPGSVLESFSFTGQMDLYGSHGLLIGTSVSHPQLTPGTDYWLVASAPSSTLAGWSLFSLPVEGLHASSRDGGAWEVFSDTPGAFRVNGTVVPVPGAALLGVLGLSSAGWLVRRRTA